LALIWSHSDKVNGLHINVAPLNENCKNNLPTSGMKLPSSNFYSCTYMLYIHTYIFNESLDRRTNSVNLKMKYLQYYIRFERWLKTSSCNDITDWFLTKHYVAKQYVETVKSWGRSQAHCYYLTTTAKPTMTTETAEWHSTVGDFNTNAAVDYVIILL